MISTSTLPNIHEILKKNMKILYNSEKMKRIFDESPIVSYKRDKNIKDILVHHKHNLQFYGKENGCRACGKLITSLFDINNCFTFCTQNTINYCNSFTIYAPLGLNIKLDRH
jgi:hypothetical protein